MTIDQIKLAIRLGHKVMYLPDTDEYKHTCYPFVCNDCPFYKYDNNNDGVCELQDDDIIQYEQLQTEYPELLL
jgi:hypothetical protein